LYYLNVIRVSGQSLFFIVLLQKGEESPDFIAWRQAKMIVGNAHQGV